MKCADASCVSLHHDLCSGDARRISMPVDIGCVVCVLLDFGIGLFQWTQRQCTLIFCSLPLAIGKLIPLCFHIACCVRLVLEIAEDILSPNYSYWGQDSANNQQRFVQSCGIIYYLLTYSGAIGFRSTAKMIPSMPSLLLSFTSFSAKVECLWSISQMYAIICNCYIKFWMRN